MTGSPWFLAGFAAGAVAGAVVGAVVVALCVAASGRPPAPICRACTDTGVQVHRVDSRLTKTWCPECVLGRAYRRAATGPRSLRSTDRGAS